MLIVGIKERNFPDAIERTVLFNFIRKKYAGHTSDEIRLAFEKAVARELDLEEGEIKHYENFSCEYFGRIMNAYRKWAKKEDAKINSNVQTLISLPEISDQELIEGARQCFSLTGMHELISPDVFDLLVKEGKIKMTRQHKLELMESVERSVAARRKEDSDYSSDWAKCIDPEERLRNECKKKAVANYFNQLKSEVEKLDA